MTSFIKQVRNAVKHWYLPLIAGILFLILGIYTLASPLESFVALSFLFSLTFLFSGLIEVIFSISNKNEIDNWGWSLFFGIVNLLVGLLLIIHPEISMATLPFMLVF